MRENVRDNINIVVGGSIRFSGKMRRIGPKKKMAAVQRPIFFRRRRSFGVKSVNIQPVRWLYHIARRGEQITAKDGFVHASFAGAVRESAAVHFAGIDPASLTVSAIDPRRLDARVELANTQRGVMPH